MEALQNQEPYIDTEELLKKIPISKSMVTKLCKKIENPLPHVRFGTRYAFRWSSVSAWIESTNRN